MSGWAEGGGGGGGGVEDWVGVAGCVALKLGLKAGLKGRKEGGHGYGHGHVSRWRLISLSNEIHTYAQGDGDDLLYLRASRCASGGCCFRFRFFFFFWRDNYLPS